MKRFAWLLVPVLLAGCAGRDVRPGAAAAPGAAAEVAVERSATDPWEDFNRSMFAFNEALDQALLRPAARGYTRAVPAVARGTIANFFTNLWQPIDALNLLLQGHPGQAGSALGRFVFNATLGLGGLLDPASAAGIPLRKTGFGQTLGRWGWVDSRYLVLPVVGPSTVRDGLGYGAGFLVSPLRYVMQGEDARWPVYGLYALDLRAGLLPLEALTEDAEDRYLMIRDAYLQRQRCQIIDCSSELPDYLLDEDFDMP